MIFNTILDKKETFTIKFSFILILFFLFSINFSIALCYISFLILIITASFQYFKNKSKLKLPPYFKFLILFSLLTLISTIFSIDKMASIKDNKELFIYLLIPIFILIIKKTSMLLISIYTVFISAILSSIIGIAISLHEGVSLSHRLKGFSSHWMTYSGLLMMTFVFFTVFNTYEKNIKKRTLVFLFLIPIMISILLSLTRSAWIGTFVSLGIFGVYFFRNRIKVLIFPTIILILIFIFLPGSVKARFFSIFDLNNVTTKDRLYMAYTTMEIIKEYPLTGVGPDNVKKVYPDYRHKDAKKNNPHLHNNFFQIIAERGIFTMLSFTAFLICIPIGLVRKIRGGTTLEKRISSSVFFAVIAFVTAGMFEYNFGDAEIKFLFLFFISLPYINMFEP